MLFLFVVLMCWLSYITYSVVVVVVVVVVRGIVRIIQKDDPGLIFVPFFCLHYYTLSGRIRYNIQTWLCVCVLFIQKDVFGYDLV